jgi:hypothetical protein
MSKKIGLSLPGFCFHSSILACLLVLITSSCGWAQQWAREMFVQMDHDFGTVPRGAKTEFEFKFMNKYKENVHVASVRTSCQCTLPRIGKAELKTYEEGSIIAEFNTRAFIGSRAAVITVVFDRPFYAEVQLNVRGTIRSDIVPEPGEIQFGEVDEGQEKATTVKISYAGAAVWEIKDVRSANKHLAVKLENKTTKGNSTQYTMHVRLKGDAPPGELIDEIVLVTNETQANLVTLPVRANIIAPLSMAQSIELGTIRSGESSKDRLVIKSKMPFRIEKVECEDKRFTFEIPMGEKAFHFIPFEFKTDENLGAFRQKVVVHTSRQEPASASTTITGNVAD